MDKMETCSANLLDTVTGYEMNAMAYKVSRMHHTRKQLRTWPQGGKTAQLSNAVHRE